MLDKILEWLIVGFFGFFLGYVIFDKAEKDFTNEEIEEYTIKPSFFTKPPKDGLKEALDYYGIEHKDIVYAQAVLETGHFKSKLCTVDNNLFGLYNSTKGRYHKFNHWHESVKAYKDWIQCRYDSTENYYNFLDRIMYAKNPDYIKTLKNLNNRLLRN